MNLTVTFLSLSFFYLDFSEKLLNCFTFYIFYINVLKYQYIYIYLLIYKLNKKKLSLRAVVDIKKFTRSNNLSLKTCYKRRINGIRCFIIFHIIIKLEIRTN